MTELDIENALSSIDFSEHVQDPAHKPEWFTNEGLKNTWDNVYVARRRVFPDGQCEVSVCLERTFNGPAITPKTRAKRGESDNREANEDDAGRRAKKNVRHRCKTIGADRMVTLTYRENMLDRAKALKDWDAFRRRLGKVKKFHYVAVIEEQERGALHFHVAVAGRQSYLLLRSIWQSIIGQDEEGRQMGQVNVSNPAQWGWGPKGAHKLASYIAKYCGKDMQARELDQKRYFASKGIPVPEVHYWRLSGCVNQQQAAEAAFAMLAGHSMNGLQIWCNNALGVVYLSTEPGFLTDEQVCPF